MEKIKSFVYVLALVFYPIISHAQVRRIEEVRAIIKDISYSQNFEYYDIIFGWKTAPYNFVSLKDIEKENLTEVEKDLLKQYEDVAFCFRKGKIHHCYWVKDENARTGLVKFDGTVLIPPVSGRYFPAPTSKTVIVGEVTLTPNQWAANYYNSLTYLNSLGFGQFKAVVEDIENKNIHTQIPFGKYNDIKFVLKGVKAYYLVSQLNDNNILWGVIDKKGKVIIPIEYKGVYLRPKKLTSLNGDNLGGKWIATNEMDMDEIAYMINNKNAKMENIRENIVGVVSDMNEALETIDSSNNGILSNERGNNGSNKSDYVSRYQRWENRAKQNYNSITNLGVRVKKNGKDSGGTAAQSMSGANYVSMKKALREAQSEMARIRKEAAKKGISIQKSEYEEIKVKY